MALIPTYGTDTSGNYWDVPTSVPGVAIDNDELIPFDKNKQQLLLLDNPTASPITCTIDGDGGTSVSVPGIGPVNVSGGVAITVAAGGSTGVVLLAIREYCQGVVHLTGGTGLLARIFLVVK